MKWRKRNVTVKVRMLLRMCPGSLSAAPISRSLLGPPRLLLLALQLIILDSMYKWMCMACSGSPFPCLVVQSPAASYQLLHFFGYRGHLQHPTSKRHAAMLETWVSTLMKVVALVWSTLHYPTAKEKSWHLRPHHITKTSNCQDKETLTFHHPFANVSRI